MPRAATTGLFTVLALLAFASNSLLTRLALAGGSIDAGTFTFVRLTAGAVALAALVRLQAGSWSLLRRRDVKGPLALFGYAAPFSFAYLRIGAALGALVLFGVVQITMISWGIARGERLGARTWLGLAVAVAGLAGLTLPSAARPDPVGMLLMIVAGISWGVYSLHGKKKPTTRQTTTEGARQAADPDPIAATAHNFLLSAPLGLLVAAATFGSATIHSRGVILAAVSGAVTSGLGYAIWYRALRGLAAARAAVVQLCVPVIAAAGAVAFLHETASSRLLVCGAAILGGVVLVVAQKGERRKP